MITNLVHQFPFCSQFNHFPALLDGKTEWLFTKNMNIMLAGHGSPFLHAVWWVWQQTMLPDHFH